MSKTAPNPYPHGARDSMEDKTNKKNEIHSMLEANASIASIIGKGLGKNKAGKKNRKCRECYVVNMVAREGCLTEKVTFGKKLRD